MKKKKHDTKLLVGPELTENCVCIVKRKCRESHDSSKVNKKNKCEVYIQRNMLSVHSESELETRDTEVDKLEHIDTELSGKNVICSADLITVINKFMYNSHDRPDLKLYPDMFLKCASEPSACIDIHTVSVNILIQPQ